MEPLANNLPAATIATSKPPPAKWIIYASCIGCVVAAIVCVAIAVKRRKKSS